MPYDEAALQAGAALLARLLPLAQADMATRPGATACPTANERAAAHRLRAGGACALIVRAVEVGWTVEFVADPGQDSHVVVGAPEASTTAAAAALAARKLLADLLGIASDDAQVGSFALQGVMLPLSAPALRALAASPTLDCPAMATERIEALLAADFPAGYSHAGFARLPAERRRLWMEAVHRAALAGLNRHPPG